MPRRWFSTTSTVTNVYLPTVAAAQHVGVASWPLHTRGCAACGYVSTTTWCPMHPVRLTHVDAHTHLPTRAHTAETTAKDEYERPHADTTPRQRRPPYCTCQSRPGLVEAGCPRRCICAVETTPAALFGRPASNHRQRPTRRGGMSIHAPNPLRGATCRASRSLCQGRPVLLARAPTRNHGQPGTTLPACAQAALARRGGAWQQPTAPVLLRLGSGHAHTLLEAGPLRMCSYSSSHDQDGANQPAPVFRDTSHKDTTSTSICAMTVVVGYLTLAGWCCAIVASTSYPRHHHPCPLSRSFF